MTDAAPLFHRSFAPPVSAQWKTGTNKRSVWTGESDAAIFVPFDRAALPIGVDDTGKEPLA
jgi:hypothetical protein